MKTALIFTLFLAALTLGNAYSKYGRTCKDIGCTNNEKCIMAEDVCTVENKGHCGSYPTCQRVRRSTSTCETHICGPQLHCSMDEGYPTCVHDLPIKKDKRQAQNYNPYQYGGQTTIYPNIQNQYRPNDPYNSGAIKGGNLGYQQGTHQQTPGSNYPAYGQSSQFPGSYSGSTGTQHQSQPYYPGSGAYNQPHNTGNVQPHQPGYQQGRYNSSFPSSSQSYYPQNVHSQVPGSSNTDFYKQQSQGNVNYNPTQSRYNQPGYNQPGYNQPGYSQSPYNQPGYNQPGYNQPGYNQPAYNPQYTGQRYKRNSYGQYAASAPVNPYNNQYYTATTTVYPALPAYGNSYTTPRTAYPTTRYNNYPTNANYYTTPRPNYYPSQNVHYYPTPRPNSAYPTQQYQGNYYPQSGSRYPTQGNYPNQWYGNQYGNYQQPPYSQYNNQQYATPKYSNKQESSIWDTITGFVKTII